MIRQQVKALFKGPRNFRNDAFPVVREYFDRKMLAKLGFHGNSTAELPWQKFCRFQTVNDEIERLKAEDQEKTKKQQRARRR